MDMFLTLPTLLAIALFIGIVTLVKLLLTPDNAFERRSQSDRRKGRKQPEFPFYDCDNNWVTDERRMLADRRNQKFIITIRRYPSQR